MNFWKNEEKGEIAGSERGSVDGDSVFLTDKEFSRNSILICATHGNIYAIHKKDGSRLWRAKFPAMGGIISLFVTDDDKLIAGANGKTACLNLMNGETIWMNRMAVSSFSF
jgi:outer membrane protein assembly factor BamB